ncbi:MAG: hypothetical protein NZ520_11120 [bacterium]|nr:hypothetical protein [bacterium]
MLSMTVGRFALHIPVILSEAKNLHPQVRRDTPFTSSATEP